MQGISGKLKEWSYKENKQKIEKGEKKKRRRKCWRIQGSNQKTKRKKDLPEKQTEAKKDRRFTLEKAGGKIFNIIIKKNLSDMESKDNVSEDEDEKK